MPNRRRATALLALPALLLVPAAGAVADDHGHDLRDDVSDGPLPTPDWTIAGLGHGHGVGMSQVGAYAMARDGASAEDILAHYYTGLELQTRDDDPTIRVALGVDRQAPSLTPDADLPWQICDADDPSTPAEDIACLDAGIVQPAGARWTVTPTEDGFVFEGTDAPEEPLDVSRLRADHDGDGIEWHDDGETYRYGVHELVASEDDGEATVHVVQQLGLERYVEGVDEVPFGWGADGSAALEAQAIAARTYARVSLGTPRPSCACDVLKTDNDQVYSGAVAEGTTAGQWWLDAVEATRGTIGTAGGAPVQLLYAASHGERSEDIEDRPWAFNPSPHVAAVHRSVESHSQDPSVRDIAAGNRSSWSAAVDGRALAERLRVDSIADIEITDRTSGGSPKTLLITTADGDEIVFGGEGIVAGESLRRVEGEVRGRDGEVIYEDHQMLSSQITAVEAESRFDDVSSGDTHLHGIEVLAELDVTRGVTATTFAPNGTVTRAQMASFLDATFDLEAAPGHGFDDVAADDTHADAIGALAAAGITEGTGDGRFAPNEQVTREQMASFLARAAGYDDVAADGRFDDVEADDVHAGAIHAIADRGVTAGVEDGRFAPQRDVARGQMATFLTRLIDDLR